MRRKEFFTALGMTFAVFAGLFPGGNPLRLHGAERLS